MNIRQLDIMQGEDWDTFVRAHDQATFFHLTGWGRAIQATFGHKPCYYYAEENGKIIGILPLIHMRSRLFGDALISNAFAVTGGPVADRADVHAALDEQARKLAVDLKVEYVEYRDQERIRPDWPAKDELYVTFRKQLDPDNENNMKAIPRKQRAMVRKGIKAGLTAVIDQNVDRLYRMYAESVRNLGTPVFPRSLFVNLLNEFGPNNACDILTVEHEGRAVSSVMNFYFRDEVLPYYGGGTLDARNYAANDFMYWAVMSRAVDEKSCKWFDFGRSKIGTGSYSFKKNWGFEAKPLMYEYLLESGVSMPDVNPLNPKYQLMIAVWKRLPLPVANFIGPMVSRSLG